MARVRYIHIGFSGSANTADIESRVNKAIDWVRYTPTAYIVRTTSAPEKWYERLSPIIASADNLFICELDIRHRSGHLSKWIWDWIQQHPNETRREEEAE